MIDDHEWQGIYARIAQAQNEERAARQRHIVDVARDLRAEFRREIVSLREDVGEFVAEAHVALRAEESHRIAAVDALQRACDARTGHLA